MTTEQDGRTFAFGPGEIDVAADGAVAAVRHPVTGRSVLLDEHGIEVEAHIHSPDFHWGKGFAVLGGQGHRFDHPATVGWLDDGVDLAHRLGGVDLLIERRFGDQWRESYTLHNSTERPVTVGTFAISTPWRDLYGTAEDSLAAAVHAHIWTGGADSWVWAVPMNGQDLGVGLQVTDGELWAYSVSSRSIVTSSNTRGHVYLHVTDHARSPEAMGGQPEITLSPGQELRLSWSLSWYPNRAAFHADRSGPAFIAPRLTAPIGSQIEVQVGAGWTAEEPLPTIADEPGPRFLEATRDGRRARIALHVHPPLRQLCEQRAGFLIERQRPSERAGARANAFVPYDNASALTVVDAGWLDWSDTRERVGSALFLQELQRLGWGDPTMINDALAGYREFVTECVIMPDGVVVDDQRRERAPRLYNFPWFARLMINYGDLEQAALIMEAYYRLGGTQFLAFEIGAVVTDLAAMLRADQQPERAEALTAHLIEHARSSLADGSRLRAHEVNYEQSMVAPMVHLLLTVHRLAPEQVPEASLLERLRWLQAFAGDQPDVRLRNVPIRHWDGYWFGRDRLWGDVFPHYWSVLSAGVFLDWPDGLLPDGETAALRQAGKEILRANLTSFAPDGSATCAFVYPSCVNGRPAYRADPLANDQDWALVYALRYGL